MTPRYAIAVSIVAPILLVLPAGGVSVEAEAPRFDTEVVARCDPQTHRIEATATLAIASWGTADPVIALRDGLRVLDTVLDGRPIPFDLLPPSGQEKMARLRLRPADAPTGPSRCTIRYEGEIYEPPRVAQFSRERIADETEGTIQEEGIYLAPESGWYPRIASAAPSTFRLEVRLPAGWDAASEGTRVVPPEDAPGSVAVYEASHPTEGLHLVAGRFKRIEGEHRGVRIACLFYPEDEGLAESYLTAIRRYLDLYGEWLGPYPYDRFDVVENFFPTGYGMPSFTLLGREVIRLPFIVTTSLGHEVAHNWWGNGVFVDEAGGNWSEGLTTYVADYHYRRLDGPAAAAEYRREVCRDYTNYVSEEGRDLPLSAFTERSTPATRAVGYGKTMMVFHMLEQRLGKERFDATLRRVFRERLYRRASWDTWRDAFSAEAKEDLRWFFDQWIGKPGAPKLALEDVRIRTVSEPGDDVEVTGVLLESGGDYRVRVPLLFEGEAGSRRETVEVHGTRTPFRVRLGFRPTSLRVDPDQDVFRRLDPLEIPPILSRLLGDPKTLYVVDDGAGPEIAAAYRELAKTLTRTGEGEVVDASSVKPGSLAGRSVFLLGAPREGPLTRLLTSLPQEVRLEGDRFFVGGTEYHEPGASLLVVARHPGDPGRAIALFHGQSAAAVTAAGRKLVHYGKYSFLAFVDGANRAKGVAEVRGGPLVHFFPRVDGTP